MTVTMILTIISGVLVLLVALISILAKITKNKALTKLSDQINVVYQTVANSMKSVENFKELSSDEKKELCCDKIKIICAECGIDWRKYDLDKLIEFYMDVANNINSREK